MKVLGFTSTLVPLVLTGKKTSTWRLYDRRNITPGEVLLFEETESKKPFALALVKKVRTKRLEEVRSADYVGHEQYDDTATMYQTLQQYYGNLALPQAPLRIVEFELLKKFSSCAFT